MPAKQPKDVSKAPVYTMAHEEQVQLLSDALLREYMHRRGFLATLKAFDKEHPRDDKTISSRALMSDLMAVQPEDQQRLKSEGVETIMEMLCDLRVERRMEVERLKAEAEMPLPKVSAKYEALKEKQAEREARKGKKQSKHGSKKPVSSKKATTDDAPSGKKEKRIASAKFPATRGPAESNAAADMTIEDLLGSSNSSRSSSRSSSDAGSDSDDAPTSTKQRAAAVAASPQGQSNADASNPATTFGSRSGGAVVNGVPAVQPAWMEMTAKKKNAKQAAAEENESEDAHGSGDDDDAGDADVDEVEVLGGEALSTNIRDQLSTAFQLLCGFDGGLSRAFVEQGFTFDDELDCALIQWRPGGCDAVLSPVQAFVVAYYYEREVYVRKEHHRRECLLRALCTILEQTQPSASKIVLIDGRWRLESKASRLTRAQLRRHADSPRVRCWTQLESFEEVRDVLNDLLLAEDRWMEPRGSGLLSFLFSVLLSHSVNAIQRELANAAATATTSSTTDGPAPLLSATPDGHAALALANVVLAGKAISYRHNGVQRGHEVGYGTKLKCGLLCGDATPTDTDAGLPAATAYTYSTEPTLPSWVVWHKNQFANLYMKKDTRQVFQQKLNLGGSATEELFYWDAATEDDIVALSVTVRSITLGTGGVSGSTRNAKSFVNAAVTSVPAWSTAEVNWNGEAPLRD